MSSSTIPKKTLDTVDRRAGYKCEFSGDTRNLQHCHIVHRGMGGRKGKWIKIIHDPRNVCLLTQYLHDVLDNRVKSPPGTKEKLLLYLKLKIDWFSWANEYGFTEEK